MNLINQSDLIVMLVNLQMRLVVNKMSFGQRQLPLGHFNVDLSDSVNKNVKMISFIKVVFMVELLCWIALDCTSVSNKVTKSIISSSS